MIDVEFKENCRVFFRILLIWNFVLTILLFGVTMELASFKERVFPSQENIELTLDRLELEPIPVDNIVWR